MLLCYYVLATQINWKWSGQRWEVMQQVDDKYAMMATFWECWGKERDSCNSASRSTILISLCSHTERACVYVYHLIYNFVLAYVKGLIWRWYVWNTKTHAWATTKPKHYKKFGYVSLKNHKVGYISSLSHLHVWFTWVNDMWVTMVETEILMD